MKFSLYFMGFEDPQDIPANKKGRMEWAFSQKAILELAQNWGIETNNNFIILEILNTEGHTGIMVPDLNIACERLEKLDVPFSKKPTDAEQNESFDQDGYWIELFNAKGVSDKICDEL